jgi:transcription elongation factor Elf1
MSSNPAAADRRQHKRQRKLGPNAACVLCGERHPDALILERHHIALVENEPNVAVVLCKNCHAVVQESLRRTGVVEWEPVADTFVERQVAMLRGEADFLDQLAKSRRVVAHRLEALTSHLDKDCPGWRKWPEALP